MEQRMGSTWRMTVNERSFIETALLKDLRVDGRRPFDYRPLSIKLEREDGSSEVHLGQTHVMAHVTGQLVQPYRDRPNEGTFSVFTEFSPMADPSFEVGRPGESAIELGRVIDRGLRESKAIDMESLAVVAGKYVWSIRLDIHILDNCGNLIDAANIAALAALLTFTRPECTVEGENGQEVVVHPPETREPIPLVIHHLPVAVTFAFFNEGNVTVIDPTYSEEAVMRGRMTATLNLNGDVCSIQKAGGQGVTSSVVMQCLRIASMKSADITKEIKNAVETYNTERTHRKVKRHTSLAAIEVDMADVKDSICDLSAHGAVEINNDTIKIHRAKEKASYKGGGAGNDQDVKPILGASEWNPYSKGISSDLLNRSSAAPGSSTMHKETAVEVQNLDKIHHEQSTVKGDSVSIKIESSSEIQQASSAKTLMDAVKPKHRRKKKASTDQ